MQGSMQGQRWQRVLRDVREQTSSDPPGACGSGRARSSIAEHDAVRGRNFTRQECLRFAVSRQGRMGQRARAADRRDVRAGKVSGGPRAGCAVRKMGLACMFPLSRRHAGWRKPRAGPSIAGWCPHPTGSNVPFSATRTRAAQNGGWHSPTRAWPCVFDPGAPGRWFNATPFPVSARRPATGPFPSPP